MMVKVESLHEVGPQRYTTQEKNKRLCPCLSVYDAIELEENKNNNKSKNSFPTGGAQFCCPLRVSLTDCLAACLSVRPFVRLSGWLLSADCCCCCYSTTS